MRAYDIIAKKRDGGELTQEELAYIIQGFTNNQIPDYQMSALAMAIFIRGMNERETGDLTMAMVNSGERIDLSSIAGIKVDKHSTGGVGDKTTLVLAPLVAAAGAPVAKMSGRGLVHTGGTLDKFEAIPGFRVELTTPEFINNVNTVKVAVVGQTGNLAPADKKLYALRDVTATVNCIPLIASSIMSKKIASGADAIVLDVKTGSGAFMKTLEHSFSLAQSMVAIGTHVGRNTVAVVTGMEQPLGYAIGNALEVQEAIVTLQGKGPQDLQELCLTLGAHMLVLARVADTWQQGYSKLQSLIADGSALEKLKALIKAQGGNPIIVDQPGYLPSAAYQLEVLAPVGGYIQAMEAESLGIAATILGAGRETKESVVDPSVGIVIRKKTADPVEVGESLAVIHANNQEKAEEVRQRVLAAYNIGSAAIPNPRLIFGAVTKDGITKY
jgi:pyrimidine-nucleoside phosphorylase